MQPAIQVRIQNQGLILYAGMYDKTPAGTVKQIFIKSHCITPASFFKNTLEKTAVSV
jgi:hypothetical protein